MAVTARKYNPGFLTDDELVASFCVRTVELEMMVEVLRECTGPSNPHQIVIGPRGSGKTSLLLRIAAEVRRDADLAAKMFPVVFAEESYEVATAGEFWLECLSHLAAQAPRQENDPELHRSFEELRTIGDDRELANRCLGALLDFSDREDKRLVLMVENLDMMFRDMADADAGWRLRKVLQTEPRIILLASATSRFDEIDDPKHALYDHFSVRTLRPLDTSECATLWEAVAGRCPPPGTIRSLQILTGGSPRLITIVARFGAELSFRKLMASLLDLVDDHTEYFKSHLESLPAQERRVYLALAVLWKPATTREISDQARMETSKCSAQLTRLIGRGTVQSAGGSARRKQYYLTERLYNIYYLLRRSRRSDRLVEALIHFMEAYYSPSELKDIGARIIREAESFSTEMQLLPQAALARLMELPALSGHREELLAMIPEGFAVFPGLGSVPADEARAAVAAMKPNELGADRLHKSSDEEEQTARELFDTASALDDQDLAEDALTAYGEVARRFGESENPSVLEWAAIALVSKGLVLQRLHRADNALAICDEVARRFGTGETPILVQQVAMALVMKGLALHEIDRTDEALVACDEVVHRFGKNETPILVQQVATALVNRGLVLQRLRRVDDALATYDEAIRRFKKGNATLFVGLITMALIKKGELLRVLNRPLDALTAYDEAVRRIGGNENPSLVRQVAMALVSKGFILQQLNRTDDVLAACDEVVHRFGKDDSPILVQQVGMALLLKGLVLHEISRTADALAVYDDVIRRLGKDNNPIVIQQVAQALAMKGLMLQRLNRSEEALAACNEVVHRFGEDENPLVVWQVAFALVSKGLTLQWMSRTGDALAAYEELVCRFGENETPEIRELVEDTLLRIATIELKSKRYSVAAKTADQVLGQRQPDSPERHVRGYLIRARATLAGGDRSACEHDVETVLMLLREVGSLPKESVDTLTFFSVALGPERMNELIKASPSADLLLPLSTALELELGVEPRVAQEVREIAEDIRRDLAKLREVGTGGSGGEKVVSATAEGSERKDA